MKLHELEYDASAIITSPVIRSAPPAFWTDARKRGIIPESLYLFYHSAAYCSIDKAPPIFNDGGRLLITYLGIILDAIVNSFSESQELLDSIIAIDKELYTPIKAAKGEKWNDDAPKLQARSLKIFILEIFGALDLLSELVSLILTDVVPGNKVGKSLYSKMYNWLRSASPEQDTLFSDPVKGQAKTLYETLIDEHDIEGPEKDWFELLRMYRNKITHLGAPTIRKILLHDEKGEFYKFLPKSWPFIWEKDIKMPGESDGSEKRVGLEFIEGIVINEDMLS